MDQWDRDDQAAADAAEGERLRAALAQPRWVDLYGMDPHFTDTTERCWRCGGPGRAS